MFTSSKPTAAATMLSGADDASLEFQEASLLVGATVTVIGELHRGVDGQLSLKPGPPWDIMGL